MTESETAQLLHMSPSEFCRRAKDLERNLGMPKRHPVLKRRDSVAFHQWLDRMFGVTRKPDNISDLVRQRMGMLGEDGTRAH